MIFQPAQRRQLCKANNSASGYRRSHLGSTICLPYNRNFEWMTTRQRDWNRLAGTARLFNRPLIFYSSFNEIILQFYKEQSVKKSLVGNCVPALPVLHFLRRESKPFEDVICNKPVDFGNWKWWGLDELPYREIRRNITERFVSLIISVILI